LFVIKLSWRCAGLSRVRRNFVSHEATKKSLNSVRPELVEGPFFSSGLRERRCFDKLSTNGREDIFVASCETI